MAFQRRFNFAPWPDSSRYQLSRIEQIITSYFSESTAKGRMLLKLQAPIDHENYLNYMPAAMRLYQLTVLQIG